MRGVAKEVNGEIIFIPDPVQPVLKVGIYWCVDNVIVGDAVPIDTAEPYGEALQYGGHYDYWLQMTPSSPSELKLKGHAYDYYPRGRLVVFPARKTVRLYVDGCMDNDDLNNALDFFGHDEFNIEIETDSHYRCSRCNRNFIDENIWN